MTLHTFTHSKSRLATLKIDDNLASRGWELLSLRNNEVPDALINFDLNRMIVGNAAMPFVFGSPFNDPRPELTGLRVAALIASGKALSDDRKVRLDEEPGLSGIVRLSGTTYFNGLATNELTMADLEVDGELVLSGFSNAFPNEAVPCLGASTMSNHIGCAALAIDDHGVLQLCVTGKASAVAGRKVSASSAGSVDMDDFLDETDLKKVIIKTVERELREEAGLPENALLETLLTGFVRDLERGGKPEFLAVIRYRGTWRTPDNRSEAERLFTEDFIRLDLRKLHLDGLVDWLRVNEDRTSFALKSAAHLFLMQFRDPDSPVAKEFSKIIL